MLKISKAISAKKATEYYRGELKTNREISLSNSSPGNALDAESVERTSGKWYGKLAEQMNLEGAVQTEQFERLCAGLDPHTGEKLVRGAPVKHYTNKFGKEITTMEHRALWDATFSAPKSVSLAATVGGDQRIRTAHGESVKTALGELEKYMEARIGGNNPSERTGKMISALFEHDTARPDKLLKYAAPQLHTHAVIFNMTETADGTIKPVQPLELYRTQTYATAVYRIELADRLQKLGYQIEIDPKTKAPEIKGFSSEYLKESSLRSQELRQETEIVKSRFEQAGANIKSDAGIRQIAAWQGRESKGFDPEEMRTRTLEMEVKYDFQAQRIYGQALQNNGYQYDAALQQQKAQEAIDFAKAIASPQAGIQNDLLQSSLPQLETEATAKLTERQFLTEALSRGIGTTNFAETLQEYSRRSASGEFFNLIKDESEKLTTRQFNQEPAKEISIESGKSINESSKPESLQKEIKSGKEMEKLSMDDLENAIREKLIVEKEVAQSFELLIAI